MLSEQHLSERRLSDEGSDGGPGRPRAQTPVDPRHSHPELAPALMPHVPPARRSDGLQELLHQALDRSFWLDFPRPFRSGALREILDREFSRYHRFARLGEWIGDLKGMLRGVAEPEDDVTSVATSIESLLSGPHPR